MYDFQEDGPRRFDSVVLRPIVSVALAGPGATGAVSPGAYALVDSGCAHVLASPSMAVQCGVDPRDSDRSLKLAIGGKEPVIRFMDLKLRLLDPTGDDDSYLEWETEVGFLEEWKPTFQVLLGCTGFLDKFTVTISAYSRQTLVDDVEAFDRRHGIPLAAEPPTRPRWSHR